MIALALAVLLGIPDHVLATYTQYAFLTAIAAVFATATGSALVIERRSGK